MSNYQADKGGVNVGGLQRRACNKLTAASGQYAGVARFYEVTKGKATGAASAFIGWIEPPRRRARSSPPSGFRSTASHGCWSDSRRPWPDHRAERTLGAVSLLVCVVVVAMVVFVAVHAWPIFEHNGLSWLRPGGGHLETQIATMQATSVNPPASAFHLRAWPLIYGTLLTTGIAVVLGLAIAVLSSIFIVELAPPRLRRLAIPVIRLLASVPSVIYGLIGILVLVPFVGNHLITAHEKASVQNVVELTGAGPGGDRRDPHGDDHADHGRADLRGARLGAANSWREGAVALGVNPLRAMLAVTLRAVRPAIVAAAVLATARALGEAVMISMVSGGALFAPKPIDGVDLLVRAAAHARLDDRRLPRRHRRPRAGLGAVCVRAAAAVLGVRAVGRRLPDQAAAAQVPDARMSCDRRPTWRTAAMQPAGRGRRSSP